MTGLTARLRAAAARLEAAGVPSARHDAETLAAHVLGVRRGELAGITEPPPDFGAALDSLMDRRAARVPLQHLTGRVGFRYIDLDVGPGVFVPRPETESVVQWAIDALATERIADPLAVDLCAGSGTIAFALANEVPGIRMHAVERDPAALAWTRRNADRLAAAGDPPVHLHLGDVATALSELAGSVDLVASNPPYVATAELDGVDPEVRDHDPRIALLAGDDGLDVIRLVEAAARRLLRSGGLVVVEHSDRQGSTAPAVFAAARCADDPCWDQVRDHRDLAGRDRFVTARRRSCPALPR